MFDLQAGFGVSEVKGLLKHHGVKVWGETIMDDATGMTGRKPQAQRARYLLEREGVPLLGRGSRRW